jgi:hypothetical protein
MKVNYDFESIGIGVEKIKTETKQLINKSKEAKESKGLFTVKTASLTKTAHQLKKGD